MSMLYSRTGCATIIGGVWKESDFFSRSQIVTIKNEVLFGGVVNLSYLCKHKQLIPYIWQY